jgi:hypothetical protein
MTPSAIARHMPLPAGVHRISGEILSLAQCHADPDTVAEIGSLSEQQKSDLVRARWLAGEWSDILYGTAGLITLDRALQELEARSDIGRDLMAITLRSIEMAHEDTAPGKEDR